MQLSDLENLDPSTMSVEQMLMEILLRLRRPKPYTAHPRWTLSDCNSYCEITNTPIPNSELVQIPTDQGVKWGHPGLLRMVEDSGQKMFYMAWATEPDAHGNAQIDPQYLEIPPTRRGRPPGAGAKTKAERVQVDMDNYTIDDVQHMIRSQLMTAAAKEGVTELVKNAGAEFRRESAEWLRSAVLAKMSNADRLPPFEAKENMHVRSIVIPKPIVRTAPPARPAPAGGGIKASSLKGKGLAKPVTQAAVPQAPAGRKPLIR